MSTAKLSVKPTRKGHMTDCQWVTAVVSHLDKDDGIGTDSVLRFIMRHNPKKTPGALHIAVDRAVQKGWLTVVRRETRKAFAGRPGGGHPCRYLSVTEAGHALLRDIDSR